MSTIITTLLEATSTLLLFLLPCLMVAVGQQIKLEKEREKRRRDLIHEQLLLEACKKTVKDANRAQINRAKRSLETWKPIEWEEEKTVRKPRKWGTVNA